MNRRRLPISGLTVILIPALVVGCRWPGTSESPEPTKTGATSAAPTKAPRPAPEPERPETGSCYALSFDQALAPTTRLKPVSCEQEHTAVTYQVGTLDTVVSGHLLAVDSDHAQEQVARACPAGLSAYLGGDEEDLRLSMLRAVWFSPTVKQSERGQEWYRCDVIALAGPEEMAPLTEPVAGVLDTEAGSSVYGVCGTARPGDQGFRRVLCAADHTWKAIATYDIAPPAEDPPTEDLATEDPATDNPGDPADETVAYPGEEAAQAAADPVCQDAAAGIASDALDYEWGYEWPTRSQWRDGQHYGVCWSPDPP